MRPVEQLALVSRQLRAAARLSAARRTARPLQELTALKAIRDGVSTQAALAERLQIDPPAASRLVDRLVGEGLIARAPGADRRSVRLVLRRPAAAAIAIGDQVIDDVDRRLVRHLGPAEVRRLATLLSTLSAGLTADQAAPPIPTAPIKPRRSRTRAT